MDMLNSFIIFENVPRELKKIIKYFHVFKTRYFHGNNVLFVTIDDKVFGMGKNENGVLGLGHQNEVNEVEIIPELCDKGVNNFYNSEDFVFCLTSDNRIYSWGKNDYGQLGIGESKTQQIFKPVLIEYFNDKTIVQICCGYQFSSVLTSDGRMHLLGNLYYTSFVTPIERELKEEIKSINCSEIKTFCVTLSGNVYYFEDVKFAKLNSIYLDKITNIQTICSSYNYTYFISRDSIIYAFDGRISAESKPKVIIKNLNLGENIQSISIYGLNSVIYNENNVYELKDGKCNETKYSNPFDYYCDRHKVTHKTIEVNVKEEYISKFNYSPKYEGRSKAIFKEFGLIDVEKGVFSSNLKKPLGISSVDPIERLKNKIDVKFANEIVEWKDEKEDVLDRRYALSNFGPETNFWNFKKEIQARRKKFLFDDENVVVKNYKDVVVDDDDNVVVKNYKDVVVDDDDNVVVKNYKDVVVDDDDNVVVKNYKDVVVDDDDNVVENDHKDVVVDDDDDDDDDDYNNDDDSLIILKPFTITNKLGALKSKVKYFHIFYDKNGYNMLFVTHDDIVYGFGSNLVGCCGLEHNTVESEPQLISELCNKDVIRFFNGCVFAMALTNDNKIYAWGRINGQSDLHSSPTEIVKLECEINNICCLHHHALILTEEGTVYRWDENFYRKKDNEDFLSTPIKLEKLPKIKLIACDINYSLAVSEDNQIFIWGENLPPHCSMKAEDSHKFYLNIINNYNIIKFKDNIVNIGVNNSIDEKNDYIYVLTLKRQLFYCDIRSCLKKFKKIEFPDYIQSIYSYDFNNFLKKDKCNFVPELIVVTEECVYFIIQIENLVKTIYKSAYEFCANKFQITYKTINSKLHNEMMKSNQQIEGNNINDDYSF